MHFKGGINNYVQLASDLQDLYLDELKEDGEYDEWKGAKYPDIDCSIGDGPKLDIVNDNDEDDNADENDHILPHKFDTSILMGKTLEEHIEAVVITQNFQDAIDSLLSVIEDCDDTLIELNSKSNNSIVKKVEESFDYACGTLSAFTSDEFRTLSKLYCYENNYSQELANEMNMEFARINANLETDGMDDYDIADHWSRCDFYDDGE